VCHQLIGQPARLRSDLAQAKSRQHSQQCVARAGPVVHLRPLSCPAVANGCSRNKPPFRSNA
jgi:hypothetical protein